MVEASRSIRRRAILPTSLLIALVGLLTYAASGAPYQLRFAFAPLNYWIVAGMTVALPALLLWLAWLIPGKKPRLSGIALACLVALPCVVFALLALMVSPDLTGKDQSFELISETQANGTHYRLYRSDCGATCDTGLVLRQELDLSGGLRIVKKVWAQYHAHEGTVQTSGAVVQVVDSDGILASLPTR
ncbi:hypothetical protein [Viridibacterium curvum]|uniref:Uncharacterized protein n=1 Tax=Viridibacterium curvum TaxID=1101404 RepID=A0ABP9QY32_9RHOO